MNFTNYLKQAFIFLFSFLFVVTSCKKENEEPPEPTPSSSDNISGKTVRYTVLVVPGGESTFKSQKSSMGVDSATVSLVMNDSIYSVPTDTNGLATFNNLAAGIAAVTIRYPEHTTVNMIVDISAKSDTGYDSNNLRNASTMVALFPLSGRGTASISGRAFADLDLTIAGNETAPASIQVSTIIEAEQLLNYVNHTGDGEILSVSYENVINKADTDANGDYNITVPATGSGLSVVVSADDFQYTQITASGNVRKVYKAEPDTITVVSGKNYFNDILFE